MARRRGVGLAGALVVRGTVMLAAALASNGCTKSTCGADGPGCVVKVVNNSDSEYIVAFGREDAAYEFIAPAHTNVGSGEWPRRLGDPLPPITVMRSDCSPVATMTPPARVSDPTIEIAADGTMAFTGWHSVGPSETTHRCRIP